MIRVTPSLILVSSLWIALFLIDNLVFATTRHVRVCDHHHVSRQQCEAAVAVLRQRLTILLETNAQTIDRQTVASVPSLANHAHKTLTPHGFIPLPRIRPDYKRPQKRAQNLFPSKSASDDGKQEGHCLDVRSVNEPDIRSQRRKLASRSFCLHRQRVQEAGLNWQLYVIKNRKRRVGPLFVVPHDNENSAFQAAIYAVSKYGGTVVAVEANEKRLFHGQDPNRNFGINLASARACKAQRAPAPKYTKAVMRHHQPGQPIIALHSNSNGWSGGGGRGTISINRPSRVLRPFISDIARSRRLADEDTLIVLASTKPPGKDHAQTAKKHYFTKKAGIHVLYEHVKPGQNNCSLSNYVVLNNLGQYFNVEVEHGDAKTQKKVIDIVMHSLR